MRNVLAATLVGCAALASQAAFAGSDSGSTDPLARARNDLSGVIQAPAVATGGQTTAYVDPQQRARDALAGVIASSVPGAEAGAAGRTAPAELLDPHERARRDLGHAE